MDTNSSGLETSQNLIILENELAHDLTTKSFRCNFCKRGFSNAQALGGHMNIHRKDRAKLREFSNENLLSLEICRSDREENISIPPDSSLGEKSRVGNDRSHGDDQGEPPLIEEAPMPLSVNDGIERRRVELKDDELDLELRLGPEPHHHAKSK